MSNKNLEILIQNLVSEEYEKEWFEFKQNWFEPEALGEYISALSNAAAYCGKDEAYFVWGIDNTTHEIVGTDFNPYMDYKKEPLQNFLAHNLNPSIRFHFEQLEINQKKIVLLIIPSANNIPTSFREKRYIRIGSSKCNLKDYPQREKFLFSVLDKGFPTILNVKAPNQDLTFKKLFGYYGSRGILLKENTFKKNLSLLTENGDYNIQAQLLSDNSGYPLRVSIFTGHSKASNLFSVREFGYDCLLYSLDKVLQYGDVLNIIQADEQNRVVERKEVSLFDNKAFKEAIINAILHNKWVEGNEPMVSVFSDRIEILSRGTLAPTQTMEGFFQGESIPVNEKLSEIFLQLHISEKSGRGVPKITEIYGKRVFEFRENSIVVTIPFNWLKEMDKNNNQNIESQIKISALQKSILSEMRNDPNITKAQLEKLLSVSGTSIDKNISTLKKNGFIERVGSNKTGYWKLIKE